MVSSHGVPSSYTAQWRLEDRRSSLQQADSFPDRGTPRQTYNTSCTNCRRVRVKCSGGKPCKRCEKNFLDPSSSCLYDVSRRHGKRKASVLREIDTSTAEEMRADLDSEEQQQPVAAYNQQLQWQRSPLSTPLSIDTLFSGEFSPSARWESPFKSPSQLLPGPLSSSSSSSNASGISKDAFPVDDALCFIGDASNNPPGEFDSIDSFADEPLVRPLASEGILDECGPVAASSDSCECHLSNQTLLSRLTLANLDPKKIGLDQILLSFHRVTRHVVSYLACTRCDSGYPRLVNLAMLHQSQVTLLCNMTKAPTAYLGSYHSPGAIRFTLGAYQLSEDEDLRQKRQAVLSAARQTASLITDFDDVVRDHHDLELAGALEASDLAKINVKWLLETTRNLKAQLNAMLKILEQPGWAVASQTRRDIH
ncbi:hypothetical protein F5Y14DRAFT_281003 [Nemania sp. NC0429]|nr:hypothetical protein F5Y14DRAFT_281003 [Nemania sp. NC0429]